MLINAPHDREFVFHDGTRARNLLELVSKIEHLDDHGFHQFVNNHKNDFSNWIEHVLSDRTFAEELRNVHSRDDTIKAIKDKIADLTIGNSIIKIPRIEDHAGHSEKQHDEQHSHDSVSIPVHASSHVPNKGIVNDADSHNDVHKVHVHEPHILDHVPPIVSRDRHHSDDREESNSRRGWFKLFSKKGLSGNDIQKFEREEEDKLRPESELGDEVRSDARENALWVVLYVVLVLLIITLLVYKLFL